MTEPCSEANATDSAKMRKKRKRLRRIQLTVGERTQKKYHQIMLLNEFDRLVCSWLALAHAYTYLLICHTNYYQCIVSSHFSKVAMPYVHKYDIHPLDYIVLMFRLLRLNCCMLLSTAKSSTILILLRASLRVFLKFTL